MASPASPAVASAALSSSFDYTPALTSRLHPAYSHPALVAWQNDASTLRADQLVYPIFVVDSPDAKEEIKALPGQHRWGINRLDECIAPLVANGLRAVLVFGVLGAARTADKDNVGSCATDAATSPAAAALRHLRATYPQLLLMADVCLCAYTDHGHCGVMHDDGTIDNARSIKRMAEVRVSAFCFGFVPSVVAIPDCIALPLTSLTCDQIAYFYAENGAHVVAPSDMMDGRIGAIKQALQSSKLGERTAVMSYAAKFASCLYGPFREVFRCDAFHFPSQAILVTHFAFAMIYFIA